MKKDLINRNITRCTDYKCELGNICKRRLQNELDREKSEATAPVANFQGSEKEGLCEFFMNID